MDPFIGEIRIFTGNFAPTGWFLCQGQLLPISAYQALFAIIGTFYGGNGTSNFQLPNLQGRFPIGVGMAPSGQIYNIGQIGGVEQIQLSINNLPSHSHLATSPTHNHSVSVPTHTHAFTVPAHTHPYSPQCDASGGSDVTPANEYPGNSGTGIYSTAHNGAMASQTTAPSDGTTPGTTGSASGTTGNSGDTAILISVQNTGNSLPFAPTPLYVAINYIIAYNGIFPSRG
jgi:microcystin-dependent protein